MYQKFMDGRGEPFKGWVEKFLEYGWERKHLEAGDFLFQTQKGLKVGIESKSVSDLLSRLGDARRELAQLIDMVDIPILLVWGPWKRKSNDILIGGQDQLTWGRLWNLIETFEDNGIRFQLATSREHAFQRINQLFAYYQKEEHSGAIVVRRADRDRRVASLMPIPGISRKLGAGLIKKFGRLDKIAVATIEQLEMVPLIGATKARLIHDWFRREEPYR